MFSKKYSQLLFVLIVGFFTSLLMTLIITYINTGLDIYYIDRFLKAWVVSLPIAIGTVLIIAGVLIVNLLGKVNWYVQKKILKLNFCFNNGFWNEFVYDFDNYIH